MTKGPGGSGINSSSTRLMWKIGIATCCRILLNTARRFVYPFAPVLSRGLGVPLTAITSIIAINQLTGVLGPVFGPLGDRWGYRIMLISGMGMLAGGMLAAGFFPFYGVIVIALFLAGLGKNIFDPAIQGYVGRQVPYRKRGFAIGIMEVSWAGSTLIGIPLAGVLIGYFGWRAPFLVLGGLALIGMIAIGVMIPSRRLPAENSQPPVSLLGAWTMLCRKRTSAGILFFSFLVSAANDIFFVVYGVWLEHSFGLSIVVLGSTAILIGLAELLGEGLTATMADRFGLKQTAVVALVLSMASYAVLPFLGQTIGTALIAIFIVFVFVELSIVTTLSLSTEILPHARATMMSGYIGTAGLGRVCGALMGGVVWIQGGIAGIALVSVLMSILALIALLWALRNWNPLQ